MSGPPTPNDGCQPSVVSLIRPFGSATQSAGSAVNRNPAATVLVPDRVTALVTTPDDRPNSAETAPRLTLNSAMSNSLTSVLRYPKPGLVMLTPSSKYVLSCLLPPALGAPPAPSVMLLSGIPGISWKRPE